jgi:hypothetical protein
MPLPNRVSPFGELCATTARGTLMGNRGGKFHTDGRTLTSRRWASRQWICCVLDFHGRHRSVWGRYYTELFFLDEVTAFAAGHRPCFECRRKDAERFAELLSGRKPRLSAAAMDETLHAERLIGKAKRTHFRKFASLPEGAMILVDGGAFAIKGSRALRWTPVGYSPTPPPSSGTEVEVLTPPSILSVLVRGYTPIWHPSAHH